ncbi:MAG: aldehyde dehydrogenase family protein, partial [Gammaproteobacteria bacterium]
MFIDGQWVEVARRFSVFNPATGEVVGEAPDGGAVEADLAIAAATAAFPGWAARTAYQRSE